MKDLEISFPKPCGQRWEDMAPDGCNRFCSHCDRTIVDLANRDFDEAAALLTSGEGVCVRAAVDRNGEIRLRPNIRAAAGRLMLAAGASAGLLMMSGQAAAREQEPRGEIAGKIGAAYWSSDRVVATGEDGRQYRGKIKRDGRYRIRKLPPGTYSLAIDSCGSLWTVATVTVRDKEVVPYDTNDPSECIIVGMAEIKQSNG